MRKFIYIIFLFLVSFACAQEPAKNGIQFRSITFEQAKEASGKEGKMVFMHGYASWCHYCLYMTDSVYPDSTVGAFYNQHFICIKMDLEKEGAELNKTLKSHTFPTLVFFDSTGQVVHRAAGRHFKPILLELGREAIEPRRQLRTWLNFYNDGNVSADTAYQVLRKIEVAGMDTQEPLLQYLNRLKPEQVSLPENWKIINELFKSVNAPFMQTFIARKKELEKLYTSKTVNDKFISIYGFEFFMRNRLLDSVGYDKLKQTIKSNKLDIGDMICDYADLNRMKAMSQYEQYFAAAPAFIDHYCKEDASRINEVSQVFYERTRERDLLVKAEKWMRQSVQLEDAYNSNILLAGILIQMDEKVEAQRVIHHSIELAAQKNISNRSAMLLLDKCETMH